MAEMAGKDKGAFKPPEMGIMEKANAMGTSMKEGAHSMGAQAQQMMRPGQGSAAAAPTDATTRGGRRRRRSRKTKRSKKSKKSKKAKKSRKTRRGRRRH
jgi:hypothetical protein